MKIFILLIFILIESTFSAESHQYKSRWPKYFVPEFEISAFTSFPTLVNFRAETWLRTTFLPVYPSFGVNSGWSPNYMNLTAFIGANYLYDDHTTISLFMGFIENFNSWSKSNSQGQEITARYKKYFKNSFYFGYYYSGGIAWYNRKLNGHWEAEKDPNYFVPKVQIGIYVMAY